MRRCVSRFSCEWTKHTDIHFLFAFSFVTSVSLGDYHSSLNFAVVSMYVNQGYEEDEHKH